LAFTETELLTDERV